MNESFWIIPLFQNLKNEMSALSLSLALIFLFKRIPRCLRRGYYSMEKDTTIIGCAG